MTRDFGLEAHQAAEAHLHACQAALDYEDYGDYYADLDEDSDGEDVELPDYPEDMAGPYCGCQTCMVREVLHAAWPILLEAARAELIEQSRRDTLVPA